MVEHRRPSYPNWQRKRIQNPYSVSSNLTEGTSKRRSSAIPGFGNSFEHGNRPQTVRSESSGIVERVRNPAKIIREKVSVTVQRQHRCLMT